MKKLSEVGKIFTAIVCEECGGKLDSDGTFCPSCNECVEGVCKEFKTYFEFDLREWVKGWIRYLEKEPISLMEDNGIMINGRPLAWAEGLRYLFELTEEDLK